MKFNLDYYAFTCCRCSLDDIILVIERLEDKKHHRKTCTFTKKFIYAHFYQAGAYYHQPTSMTFAFSPKASPQYSVAAITQSFPYRFTLGTGNPSLEMLDFRFTNEKKGGDGQIRELGYYRGKELIRMVRVMTNPRWELCLLGEQQPFEEGKSYEKVKGKRIKDYFTQDDLIRFAANWGCPIGEDEFWDSDKPIYCWGELENDENLADWTEWPDGFKFE